MPQRSPRRVAESDTISHRDERKQDAAARLLDWGFTPAEISWITGCDEASIESVHGELHEAIGQQ